MAVDPVTPSTVYAGTLGGLLKSSDGGSSWSGSLLAERIYGLLISPQTPSTIFGTDFDNEYFFLFNSSLYKSTDAGATWSKNNTGISIYPGALAVDPTNPSVLYAGAEWSGASVGGVYKSVDSGSTWRLVRPALLSETVSALVIDPRNPGTLYAANGQQKGVVQSTDGGVSWTEFNTDLPDNFRGVTSLAIDRTGTRLYAGTYGAGVFDYQIVSSGAQDLSVGTDNKTRVLFSDLDKRAVFRSFDNSGNTAARGPHGPFSGWSATAVADGADGLTRVLWNNRDGSAALWLLGPTGNQASYRYGPRAGWAAVDVSVGSDGMTHLLWTNTDGRIDLRGLNLSGTEITSAAFGPYPGWVARSISDGADGLTRVLWSNTDGRAGLSLIDAGQIVATHRFAPGPGWTARDVAVATDNQARILFVNADGRMALWSVDNSGAVTNSASTYGPPVSGQASTRLSTGSDGLTRVLWASPEGNGTLWLMGLDNIFQKSFDFCGGFGESSGCGSWDY